MRLQAEGLTTDVEEQTTCCYAVQDKVWVHGPDAEPWEVYTVLADALTMHEVPAAPAAAASGAACCAPAAVAEPTPVSLSARCC